MPEPLRVAKEVYGGDGLLYTAKGEVVLLPFVLPDEVVELPPGQPLGGSFQVVQPSPDRVEPRCVHFGVCGGCHYQMASYEAQLRFKQSILLESLHRAGTTDLPPVQVWGSPEWGYRSRVRFRVREVECTLRLGYSARATKDFLPVRMCPIAAPALWSVAEALVQLAAANRDAAEWLRAAEEVEFSCDETGKAVQMHLLCLRDPGLRKGSLERMAETLSVRSENALVGAGASLMHAASGRVLRELATWGAAGLRYVVGEDRFWLQRGGFFQVNRFLLGTLVDLVCEERQGQLAWDLFAGVGLFSRRLTRSFQGVTAVEANPAAQPELRRGLARATDRAVQQTTLAYLQGAVLQRERPQLVVLDPPRAGAGKEVCALLARLGPAEIVYVSCDPTTLARDLEVLTASGYRVAKWHMVDLFPQTYHLETVMVVRRLPMTS